MTCKDKVIAAIKSLPDDATFEDAMERLLFMAKLERGLSQADTGMTLSHEEVRKIMSRYLD